MVTTAMWVPVCALHVAAGPTDQAGPPACCRVVAAAGWRLALAPAVAPRPLARDRWGAPPLLRRDDRGAGCGRAKSTRRTGSLRRVYAVSP